jgi:hypothetical protein
MTTSLTRHLALRYVQPLREGGSLPAVVDTDGGLFVVKFRGAGQGARVLIAEILAHGLAMALALPVPDLALVELPDRFGVSEPDPEIQELLKASRGINVGLRYLDGAFNFDPVAAADVVDADFATRLVWLDAYITNPDRSARNPNLMVWQRRPFLIDHGAALYMHYDWSAVDEARTTTSFPLIKQHVVLARMGDLEAVDEQSVSTLTDEVIARIVGTVPDELLLDPIAADGATTPDTARARYVSYLQMRRDASNQFVKAAIEARETALLAPTQPFSARR